ncbi:MAG: PP0621 family protein [Burkholderiales bacterium]
MTKLALIVIAIVAFVLWLRFSARRKREETVVPPVVRDEGAMIACAHCGVLFPGVDAVTDAGGRQFCSLSHRDLRHDSE